MRIAIAKEHTVGERRVAIVPEVAGRLVAGGHEVFVAAGAGAGAYFEDADYLEQKASILEPPELFERADVVVKVEAPSLEEAAALRPGSCVVSFLQPAQRLDLVRVLLERKITAFSLDLLPRISRAQAMDALSSQATVTGYQAALIGAQRLAKFFPMFMTAAGTIPPARVLVMGAGVAGLQAIATAHRLGAIVRAYDVRAAAREEVQSLGATFVELELETMEGAGGYAAAQSEEYLERQRELIAAEVKGADVVITTAAIPGRAAPILVTAEMVAGMRKGSIIIDLAAESGGNCELSVAGEERLHGGVLVYGAAHLASAMPIHASLLYSRNIQQFLGLIDKDGEMSIDFDDEVVKGSCVTHDGEVQHGPTAELLASEGSSQ